MTEFYKLLRKAYLGGKDTSWWYKGSDSAFFEILENIDLADYWDFFSELIFLYEKVMSIMGNDF